MSNGGKRQTDTHPLGEVRSLEDIEAMYGSLVELLPAIVYVARPQPQYETIYVSPQITSLGYSYEEWLANPTSWVDILHPDDRDRVLRATEEAVRSRGENDYEYRVLVKDGSTRWLHDRGVFVFGESGEPICWQGVLLDVTERKRQEEERERLLGELKAAVAEVKTLSGLLPICSYCKRIRDDRNYWQAIELYLEERSSAQFSHGICPECYEEVVEPMLRDLRPDE